MVSVTVIQRRLWSFCIQEGLGGFRDSYYYYLQELEVLSISSSNNFICL